MKVTAYLRNRDKWRTMLRLEKQVKKRSGEAVEDLAEAVLRDINSNWSTSSPSDSGKPPAKVSHTLSKSGSIENQGRDEQGRFAGKNSAVRYIHFDTSDNDGKQYATALEDPDYLDRPFIAPALRRASSMMSFYFKKRNLFNV